MKQGDLMLMSLYNHQKKTQGAYMLEHALIRKL